MSGIKKKVTKSFIRSLYEYTNYDVIQQMKEQQRKFIQMQKKIISNIKNGKLISKYKLIFSCFNMYITDTIKFFQGKHISVAKFNQMYPDGYDNRPIKGMNGDYEYSLGIKKINDTNLKYARQIIRFFKTPSNTDDRVNITALYAIYNMIHDYAWSFINGYSIGMNVAIQPANLDKAKNVPSLAKIFEEMIDRIVK